MCKFCNYNEGDVADEDIIDERIRIGNIPDALVWKSTLITIMMEFHV